MTWEYKFHYHPIQKNIIRYDDSLEEIEKEINEIAKKGWELFSTHVTSFNTLIFIFRKKKK